MECLPADNLIKYNIDIVQSHCQTHVKQLKQGVLNLYFIYFAFSGYTFMSRNYTVTKSNGQSNSLFL